MVAYKRLFTFEGAQFEAVARQVGRCATIVVRSDDPAATEVEYVVFDDAEPGILARVDIEALEAAIAFAIDDATNGSGNQAFNRRVPSHYDPRRGRGLRD